MNVSDFKLPVGDVYLSSAFTNRLALGDNVVIKKALTAREAFALCSIFSTAANVKFINAINPNHTSTAVLAQGLTDVPCEQMFISANIGDVIIIMIPSAASRNATEFEVDNFNECIFEVVQICDETVLK